MANDASLGNEPAKTVRRFVEAFNRVDVAGMAACFASPSFILDGMAPHVWFGPSAAADWCRDALHETEEMGVGNFRVTLGEPSHDAVSGDAAYFVAPASMTFSAGGRRVTQAGATLTIALRRLEGQWLIAAWAWTKGKGGGVDDVAG